MEEREEEVKTVKVIDANEGEFKLPNKKVKVVPVRRKGAWLPPAHEASHVFGSARKRYAPPLAGKQRIANPLTPAEQKFFERVLDEDLNPFKKFDKNYWADYYVSLGNEVLILDLSDPEDYIKYKVLLMNTEQIAPSGRLKYSKATIKYFIDDIDYEERSKYKSVTANTEAYKHLGKLEDRGKVAMVDFLKVYYSNKPGKRADYSMSIQKISTELGNIIDEDVDGFLQIAGDAEYDNRVFISKALSCRAISKDHSIYSLPNGEIIAKSEDELIAWLKDGINDEYRLQIQARIEETDK